LPFFPLPFLTAFFLVFIIVQLARFVGRGLNWVLVVTVAGFALQSILLGLAWGFQDVLRIPLISLALALPPLTWLSLNELAGRTGTRSRIIVFAGILLLIAAVNMAFLLDINLLVDVLAVVVYLGFGGHLLWQGHNPDLEWMASQPLQSLMPIQRAYFLAGTILLISAGVDIVVALDIRLNDSQISPALVGYANLTLLIILTVTFLTWREGPALPLRSSPDATRRIQSEDDTDAEEILAKLDNEMETSHLYRHESLTLNEIARRIRVPARQVSIAVNTLRAMNVPKYVNEFRIKDACRILEETDMPVTEIVFAVGFTTKSNFNREFQRITGLSPSAWRSRAGARSGKQPDRSVIADETSLSET